jgi:hypothetical protein
LVTILEEILPHLDVRPLKTISGRETVLDAMNKLRENEFELLLIESHHGSTEQRPLVISGYSIISNMMQLKPHDYASFLKSPCIESSLLVGTIGADQDILSLFHVFQSTTFGFALIHRKQGETEKISVRDLLKLYGLGMFSSNLRTVEIATSPIFELSRGSRLEEALKEMGRRKFRRVRISGTRMIVSDKQILAYLFQQSRLGQVSRSERRLLDGTLEALDLSEAPSIDGSKPISEAAEMLSAKNNECVLTDHGIVTPWDLTVKTWELGKLNMTEPSKISNFGK